MSDEKGSNSRSREHQANERTFLAWIRTSIALMGFGFVIVKFALFLKQISLLVQRSTVVPSRGYSADIGVIMVALGVLLAMLSFWQYRKTAKQLESNTYAPSSLLSVILALAIIIGGILLIIYLLPNIKL